MTLRIRLSLIIAFMGLLSMTAAYITSDIYRDLILEHEEQALSQLIKLETDVQIDAHTKLVRELAMRLQKKPDFKKSVTTNDSQKLTFFLNDEFKQYYVTTGLLDIHSIYVLNKKFDLISQSTEGRDFGMHNHYMCKEQLAMAKKRTGLDRIRVLATPCSHMGLGLFSILTPVGTLSPIGYIQVIASPAKQLAHAHTKLNMPMQLQMPNKQIEFQSKDWPDEKLINQHSLISYPIKTPSGQLAFRIHMIRNNQILFNRLNSTRNWVMSTAGIISSLLVIIFLWIMNRSLLNPLGKLTRHLANIIKRRTLLGQKLHLSGSQEIKVLNESFNTLTDSLSTAQNKLENLAYTDQLTSLPNRSKLQEILAYHTNQSKHQKAPFALLLMDLNRFKLVNDSLGHHAGDILLQQVSERLRALLRKTDIVTPLAEADLPVLRENNIARLGGDEFAAVLPTVEHQEIALNMAHKIANELLPAFIIEGREFNIGISIGIALCPQHGTDAETLMRKADIAMYQAKNQEIDATLYDADTDTYQTNMLSLESDLRDAIHNDHLELFYQPKLILQQDTVEGCEALLRWTHPRRGNIPPDQFIPIAERNGLIHALTYWVIENSFAQLSKWQQTFKNLSISINLSAHNLSDSGLCSHLHQCLNKYRLDPEHIILELTETAIMSDPQHALDVLNTASEIGMKISIDDFGTGYSSLSYLRKLPVNELKIDRTFVMDMVNEQNDAIIVKSTIDLAHNMGLTVTAEGVEDETTMQQLKALQCDTIQGYYIARPMAPADFEKWLQNSHWRLL